LDREEPEIKVDEDQAAGSAVVMLIGEHDRSTAGRLGEALERLVEQGRGIIVDVTDCSFIDSSIIAALLAAAERQPGFVLQISEASPLRRALEIVDAGQVLQMAADRSEAVALLGT
jgi:anti-anti-sigma factor